MIPDARRKPGFPASDVPIEDFYSLRFKSIWRYFAGEKFSFWMICAYLFIEYVRPQSIVPSLDILPWGKLFLILALVGRLTEKRQVWVADPANKWLTAFLLTIAVSSITAIYPDVSWGYFNEFFNWYVIYFLIINIVNTERRFLIFLCIFLLASFKISIFCARVWAMRGFSFTSWGLMGPPGYFQNSGELSVQMLMFSPVAFRIASFLKPYISRVKFWFLMLGPITGAMTVMGASSRGSQVSLVYQAYRTLLKGRVSVKRLLVIAMVVAIGLVALPDEQKERFSAAGSDDTSQQRLLYWKHGIEIIKEYPVLGIGYFNFPPYYAKHYPNDILFTSAQLPHNIFIQIGTDCGLVGIALFLVLIHRTTATARKIRQLAKSHEAKAKPFVAIADGLVVAMWGFLIAGQFVTITYYPFFWINLAFIVALRNVAERHYRDFAGERKAP